MGAIADVARTERNLCHSAPLPRRTPAVALVQALAEYPGLQLWEELHRDLPPDVADRAFEAAAQLYRDTRG